MPYQLISDQLTVLINSMGAEICSVKDKSGTEYIWRGDNEIWGRHAPVLFPIVGKLKNNSYFFNGKNYQLGQHGFARDMEFKLIERNNFSAVFELVATAATKQTYPFDFIFQIKYELKSNKLSCGYKIKNPSTEPVFFSVGAHPGFNCPLSETEKFEDYYLEFENDTFMQTTLVDGLRCGKNSIHFKENKLFLSDTLFNNDALVFENHQVRVIKLCSSKTAHRIIMTTEGWPFFGIWAKKGSRKFICLEPWHGVADDLNSNGQLEEKKGIIRLESLAEFNCSISFEAI